MSAKASALRHVELDAARLSRGERGASLPIWRQRLQGAGLLSLGSDLPPEHPASAVLEQWSLLERSAESAPKRGLIKAGIALVAWLAISLPLWIFLSVIGQGISIVLGLGAFVWILKGERRRGPSAHETDAAEGLAQAVDKLMAHSFIASHQGVVFSHSADLHFLETRIRDGERSRRAMREKTAEMLRLEKELRRSNAKLELDESDPDLEALQAEQSKLNLDYSALSDLVKELREQKEALESRTQARLALAQRQALSEQVDALVDRDAELAARQAAELEVDMLEIEGRLKALDVQVSDDDARLRATMEVRALEAAGRR